MTNANTRRAVAPVVYHKRTQQKFAAGHKRASDAQGVL